VQLGRNEAGLLESAAWDTAKVTWVACLVIGIVSLLARTLLGIWTAEPELLLSVILLTRQGMAFFRASLRYQMYGGPQPPNWRRYGLELTQGRCGSLLSYLSALVTWMLTWLPSGEIGTAAAVVANLDLDGLPSAGKSRSGSGGKSKQKKGSSAKSPSIAAATPAVTVSAPIATPPAQPAITPTNNNSNNMKKRHSMPAISVGRSTATQSTSSPTANVQGFVSVRRERTSSQIEPELEKPFQQQSGKPQLFSSSYQQQLEKSLETPPKSMPIIIEEDISSTASTSSTEYESERSDSVGSLQSLHHQQLQMGHSAWRSHSDETGSRTVSPASQVDSVESRFAKYFNSTAASRNASVDITDTNGSCSAIPIPGRVQPVAEKELGGVEKGLVQGELSPPPGFVRRTRSVAPRTASISSEQTFEQQTQAAESVNPNTTSSTTYRRPTGTFASKGYALTGETVFAARASPVDPKQAPLEKRTQNFFQQRLSVSRVSSPACPDSNASSAASSKPASPAKVQEKVMHAPAGKRASSLFPGAWTPWLASGIDEDSVVPPGAHLRPAGIIGSRPSSNSPAPERREEDPSPTRQQNQFSLFNMDLFATRP